MESKVSKEVASKEIGNWLDYKKVDEVKRKDSADNIELLVNAIESGDLSYDSKDNFLTQKLKWPIGENDAIKELKYKARLSMKDVSLRTKNVKAGDAFALIEAYICALTEQNSGIIGCLDSSTDNKIAQSIASFFL
jgi:hypothetical protein